MESPCHVGARGPALSGVERPVNGPMISLKEGVAPQVDTTHLQGLHAVAFSLTF